MTTYVAFSTAWPLRKSNAIALPTTKAQIEEYSAQFIRSSTALQRIIENMLDFANWNGEGSPAELTHLSVAKAVQSTTKRFEDVVIEKNLRLDLRIESDLYVNANPLWLGSILKHLLDNAIKFSDSGGIIAISARLRDTGMIEIVIADSGPGFPARDKDAAFVPFERLGHETGTKSGVGIGLPMAQTLADAMGGYITVDEDGSDGARVRIHLPSAKNLENASNATSAFDNLSPTDLHHI